MANTGVKSQENVKGQKGYVQINGMESIGSVPKLTDVKPQKDHILINDLKSQDGVPVCVNLLRCDKKTEMKCIDKLCKKPAEEYLLIMV